MCTHILQADIKNRKKDKAADFILKADGFQIVSQVAIITNKMGCFNDPAWKVCVADTNYLYPARWGWINVLLLKQPKQPKIEWCNDWRIFFLVFVF